ncbi:MAG: T9SS type A sorting domain-containing protein [Bacteroidia bacterium]|nr:T9SS type A sorting domain-containing protein [Bacteroidia bacterium]
MKTLFTVSLFLIGMTGVSQTIPNGGFESWNTVTFLNPSNYPQTSNYDGYRYGLPVNTTRVTDAQLGTYAVNMVTVSNSTDTMFGYFVNGDPGTLEGGIPMNQIPTSLTGYYKCSVPAGDTAIFLLVFKQAGNPIGQYIYKFTGTQSTYAPFSIPVSLPGNPDSVIVGAASSNAFQWQGIPGSMLQLDNLSFTGVSNQPPLLNGSFENWANQNMHFPSQLTVGGDTAVRTTDAYAGTYAIKLTTMDYGNNNYGQSAVTNGLFTDNGVQGGRPFSLMTDTICGYYKYLVNGIDSAALWVNITSGGNPVGGIYTGLPPVSVYTYFEFPLISGSMPDTLLFFAGSSSNNTTQANVGSRLYLDDVRLKSQPVSVTSTTHWRKQLRLSPNPATDHTRIEWNTGSSEPVVITLSDIQGKVISVFSLPGNTPHMLLDLNGFEAGAYLVNVKTQSTSLSKKLIVNGH